MRQQGLQPPALAPQAIPRRPPAAAQLCPPSIDQERLWFIDQLQPASAAYNIYTASRIEGPLDVPLLERVINELIKRHEALRTTFTDVDGQPMQRIAPALEISLAPVDLQTLPPAAREREALRRTTEDFARPFDLARGPLVRVGLLRLDAAEHVLHINMHHAITDRWSFAIFEQELAALYQAFATGQPSPLAEPPIQFGDYAVWQRARMQGAAYQQQMAYWQEKLAGAPPVLEVPTDYARPAIQTFRGGHVPVVLPKHLLDALKTLGQSEGATMHMTLMAAYKTLLYRYTGETDILVAASIANRDRPETQGLFGYLLNLLVLRTDLAGRPSFRELLRRERETALGAYAHQDVPFGKLVQELKPKQDPSRNPLVQVAFIYLDFPETTSMEFLGLKATHLDVDNGASRFDLALTLSETSAGLIGTIEYLTDLYDRTRVERMARHLEVLLTAIVADPDQSIAALPLLPPDERAQLLYTWNDTARDEPPAACVHELFEAQARARPDATAISCGAVEISYGELNRRADLLARHLSQRGVRPETRVGLCVERSIELIVGMLGVLKAGCTYVPLDPQWPRERLAFMVQDAGLAVLLTTAPLAAALSTLPCPVRQLDSLSTTDADAAHDETTAHTSVRVLPDQLVYVIYTSGSTGRPKGVMVSNQALAARTLALCDLFALDRHDRQWQFLSPAFDASAQEIFPTLACGATLVIGRHARTSSAGETAHEIARAGASIWTLPTSYWHALVDELSAAGQALPESLRLITVGGEAMRAEKLAAFRQLARHPLRLINLYGPTEATILATAYEIPYATDDDRTLGRVPIGRPLPNVRGYILDAELRPVPAGIPGELHIGGAGLARGYLGRPELTAERFIPDPFSTAPGARHYRTGDVARYLNDGRIEFVGRTDTQVKVRGYRIELGEIEAVLAAHAGVGQAVVAAHTDAAGSKRLVAYVTHASARTAAERPPTSTALREHLRAQLPEYMIPAVFVLLDKLPRTSSGKPDRRALPAPESARTDGVAYVAPRTEIEEVLAAHFAHVLGLKQIGASDNFFEAGGDSLLATQLVSRVRKSFALELPLRALFAQPTVAGLALHIEELLIAQMEHISEEDAQQLLDRAD